MPLLTSSGLDTNIGILFQMYQCSCLWSPAVFKSVKCCSLNKKTQTPQTYKVTSKIPVKVCFGGGRFFPPATASTTAEMAICGVGRSKSPEVLEGNPLKTLLLII